jgi:hypothetical protein
MSVALVGDTEAPGLSMATTFDSIGYGPHKGQRPVHRSTARHRVLDAGRRFGKTNIGGSELVLEGLVTKSLEHELRRARKRREFWIVGPEYSDAEKEFRVLYDGLNALEVPFDKPGTYNDPHGGDMQISLWRGRYLVIGKSSKMPERLVGEGLSGAVLAEVAKMKPTVWTKYIRPALADFRGWSLHTSTPEGKNHFYENWQRGQDPANTDWDSWRMPSWLNHHVFPMGATEEAVRTLQDALREGEASELLAVELGVDPEIYAMMTDMSEERFNQEVKAEFSEYVGRVFKDWDEEVHVRDIDYNPKLPVYLACDYGWTNPFVMLWIQEDAWGNLSILKEYRATHRDIGDIAEDLAEDPLARNAVELFPDPAEPGDTAILEKKLRVRANYDTGGELKHRLEYIRRSLRLRPSHVSREKQRPVLLVDRSCEGLIYEMGEYRYPENKSDSKPNREAPMDKDDHGPEALGRFFRGHYGALESTGDEGRARVRRAKVHS